MGGPPQPQPPPPPEQPQPPAKPEQPQPPAKPEPGQIEQPTRPDITQPTSGAPRWFLRTVDIAWECSVDWFTSYSAYYARLEQLMTQTADGDEIFVVGWWYEPAQILGQSTAEVCLEAARGRGARVRVLLSPAQSFMATSPDDIVKKVTKYGGEAAVDDQNIAPLSGAANTFHQKSVYVRVKKVAHLFLGGMDICLGRTSLGVTIGRTTSKSSADDLWFDAQVEITGHGAELGKRTLEERWTP